MILVIVLLVFGAGKLPQIGDALGKSIRNFKSSSSGEQNVLEVSKKKEITRGSASDDDDAVEVPAPKAKKQS